MAPRHAAASQLRSDGNGGARRLAALATAVRQWCCNLRWYFACWFDGIRALYATLPDKAFIALPLDGPAIAATGGMGRRLPDGAAPTGWSASSPEVACAGKTQRYILLLLLSSSSPRRARSLNAPNPKSTLCKALQPRILWCPGALTPLLCLVETAIRDRNRQ